MIQADAFPRRLSRRSALVLPLAAWLAACAGQTAPPVVLAPLTYAYLTKFRLNVASVAEDDASTPKPVANGEHVEQLSPVSPTAALLRMAQDRLVAAGSDGHATFVIDDAALIRVGDRFEADFAVHLDISSGDGTRTGYAEARVSRTRTITDYSPQATRVALYDLVKGAMDDMNVEFEYQVRKTLRDWLQPTAGTAPEPPPVEQQNLAPPDQSPPDQSGPVAPNS